MRRTLRNQAVLLSEADTAGLTTNYQYDGFGRVVSTVTPEGHRVETAYRWETANSIYAVTSATTTAPGRPSAKTLYDRLDREVRSSVEGYNGTMIHNDKRYNAQGQLVEISHPYFAGASPEWTIREYDLYGRIKKETVRLQTDLVTRYDYDGYSVKTTLPDTRKSVEKVFNANGDVVKIIENNDNENAIRYKYHCSGQLRQVVMNGGVTVTMSYDAYGRRDTLYDPNAGATAYTYSARGQLLTTKDAENKETIITYDNLGRIRTEAATGEATKTYEYYTAGTEIGKLKSVKSSKAEILYEYGAYGRLVKLTESLVGVESFDTWYEYDQYGNNIGMVYPGGFSIKQNYNSKGYLDEIRRGDNNALIWYNRNEDAMGQPLSYRLGNGKTTTYSYDGYHLPSLTHTAGVQSFTYDIDPYNGNVKSRRDNMRTNSNGQLLLEEFYYGQDGFDRLHSVSLNGETVLTMGYDPLGNMQSKGDVGDYQYQEADKVHALSKITNPRDAVLNSGNQSVTYNAFKKATEVRQTFREAPSVQHVLKLDYGIDNERIRTRYYAGGQLRKTKYFAAGYEKVEDHANDATQEISYISSPYGTIAAFIKADGFEEMVYIYTDHLGSITAITNQDCSYIERRSFDAWGRPRNPLTWKHENTPVMQLIDRGYTFHEHLPEFGLINMNGRMYDPIVGRFLSPDPYVQDPGSTQGYNRYSYCLNNPLKYTDPSGEWVQLVVLAAVNGLMNTMINCSQQNGNVNFGQIVGYFTVGALSSLANVGLGSMVSSTMPFGGFIGGFANGFSSSFAGSFIAGIGNSLINGSSFNNAIYTGFVAGSISGLTSGLAGGINGASLSKSAGANPWTGIKIDEYVIDEVSGGLSNADKSSAIQNAKNYDKSQAAVTDKEYLFERAGKVDATNRYKEFNRTTEAGKYGLRQDGKYVNLKTGSTVGGYVEGVPGKKTTMHISPWTTWADDVTFDAIYTHELIHVHHRYTMSPYNKYYSERVAYKYSYDTYMRANRIEDANHLRSTAFKLGFWGGYPMNYEIMPIPPVYH